MALISSYSRTSYAAASVLVVMRARETLDSAPYELRLRSELATEGIDAVVVNATAASTMQDSQQLAMRFGATDVIDVTLATPEAKVMVWVSEPSQSLDITRSTNVALTERDSVALLALRAVEVFRGARLELEQQVRAKSGSAGVAAQSSATGTSSASASGNVMTAPPASSTVSAPSKPNSQEKPAATDTSLIGPTKGTKTARPTIELAQPVVEVPPAWHSEKEFLRRFRVGGGISMMQFTDQLRRRISPTVSVSVWLRHRWGIALTFAAPYVATISYLSTSTSNNLEKNRAVIDQEFIWLDGRYRVRLGKTFDFEPTIAIGLARYGVVGRGAGTLIGHKESALSMLVSAGGSFGFRIARNFQLMAEVAGQVRLQTPSVIIDGVDVTGTSPANLWGSVGPAWSF